MENSEMYLRPRNGVWYFRRRVPSDLTDHFHPSHFTYSLGTRKRSEALKPYASALARSEQEISEAREKIKKGDEEGRCEIYPSRRESRRIEADKAKRKRARAFCQCSEAEISFLVSRWFEKERRETEAHYRDAFTLNEPEQRLEIVKELHEAEKCLMGNQPGRTTSARF